jgi:catechol 2,3-dioxygenase
LEFRVSEMLVNPEGVPVAGWLWQRPAPHHIAIVLGRAGGFHHAAFVVDSADALFRAADILTMHKARIDYGPGRQGVTRGTTIYFFDPSGNRLEAFGGYTRIRWTRTAARLS